MKIYLVMGFDFDPVERRESSVSRAFKTAEEAERYMLDLIDENRQFLDTDYSAWGIKYREVEHKLNGRLWYYEAKQEYDISTPDDKGAWLNCPRLAGCITPEEYTPSLEGNTDNIKTELAVELVLRECEI